MKLSNTLKHKYLNATIIILAAVTVVYSLLYVLPIFTISEVQISGVKEVDTPVIYRLFRDKLDRKLTLKTGKDSLEKIVNENIPQFRLVSYSITFPSKINLVFEKRDPEYAVKAANGVYELDGRGFVLGESYAIRDDEINVFYDKRLNLGTKIDDANLNAGLIYSKLGQKVVIEGDKIKIKLDGGGEAILPEKNTKETANELLIVLQKILQKYTIEGRSIDLLDLRYSKPVVKYK
ncbi:hypothetical protein A2982_01145 [candidate division WWE3 bacterium RIFCSPLOWO2_01_FULL_39_13]|uniref:POTRA domain-containing protein n=1 Tax=candidate division WWE3 bacterium RIFCSPLOWO2_01_FULL_39_13 TaxID=1802624 RepID=A0A1F4V2A6_UNCKA|nr:MAG: hypothetical protein A2982_01145 [candidate division WWE3 bacterium RIFCSPLOWO2_01_FULL_39_13]